MSVGLMTPRQNMINGAIMAIECSAARGEMTQWNAECNIRDLRGVFSDNADLRDWCNKVGIMPLAFLPPKHGPGFPPVNRDAVWNGYGCNVLPNRAWREHEGEPCEHRWIVLQWSGYDCNDCGRHFGA